MKYPTRELTKREDSLIMTILETVDIKYQHVIHEAEQALTAAKSAEVKVEVSLESDPAYQEMKRTNSMHSAEAVEYYKTLGDGDLNVGLRRFEEASRTKAAPLEDAKKARIAAMDRLDNVITERTMEHQRVIALVFLRMGFHVGLRRAFETMATGNMTDMAGLMHDAGRGDLTDARIAAHVDQVLSEFAPTFDGEGGEQA